MNALVNYAMLGVASTDTGFIPYSSSDQPLTSVDPTLKSVGNSLYALRGTSIEECIDTLPKPLKNLPSTFSRPLADKWTAPAELLAEWNGCVTSIQNVGHYFSATLRGVKGEGVKGEEDDAIIPISDVSEWDKDLLQPGNYFRLCVMHEISPSGQPRRYSLVVFRRLPAYRKQDLDEALERGCNLARGLRVE